MNYRVSVFGFLYMGREEAPGNMGLWDQLLSLKWVHKNIDLFGGDAHRVTLFGESAGAAAVSMHLLSPKSAPYFQRAILQSGSATAPWAMESRLVLRCLMDAPAELIRDSEWAPVMEFVDFPWVPVIDGDFLIEQPSSSLKQGNFKTAPLLAGSNLDESIYFIVYQLAYEPADLPVKPVDWMNALDKMLGDLQFTCNVNEFALANSVHGGIMNTVKFSLLLLS
uniref:Carboxylic ester hydrolase n=1 Tax=Parascaris equorum TaxID=6256 RepID=A0A914SHY5_PAREQ